MRRPGVGLVAWSLFQAGRLSARGARVLNHLAAGTQSIDELRAGVARNWDEFNAGDVAAGLTRWEQQMIDRFVARGDEVLLVGSGPGRDLIAMAADGHRVTGVEPAPRAVANCRQQLEQRGLSAELVEGFFEDVPLPRRFDAIIFSGCCYCFIPESRRRIAALRKAVEHLSPRGRILINYMIGAADHPALMRVARFAASISRSDWHPEPGDVVLPLNASRPLFSYEHRFGPGELESEALAAGLRVADRCAFPNAPVLVFELDA